MNTINYVTILFVAHYSLPFPLTLLHNLSSFCRFLEIMTIVHTLKSTPYLGKLYSMNRNPRQAGDHAR